MLAIESLSGVRPFFQAMTELPLTSTAQEYHSFPQFWVTAAFLIDCWFVIRPGFSTGKKWPYWIGEPKSNN